MQKRSYRITQILLADITLVVLGFSFYFQYVKGLHPCPLCIMQRICVFGMLFFTLMGIYVGTHKRVRIVTILQMIVAALGIFFASRQLWLQSLLPGEAPACGPDLDILLRYFSLQDVAKALFWGSGDCAEVTWTWLNLSMAGWSLLYFIGIFISVLFLCIKAGNHSEN